MNEIELGFEDVGYLISVKRTKLVRDAIGELCEMLI